MDESTLVNKCINGDQLAQRELFDKYASKMFGVCLRYSNSTEQAEDALQEGFIKVFTKLHKFSGDGSFEGWIRRIIVNTCLDSIRKNNKYKENQDIDDVGYKLEQHTFILDQMGEQDLLNLIKEMPEGYKIVFNMFAIEGYSHKEIAEELNISENTSKSQYSRARAYLRMKLEELGIER